MSEETPNPPIWYAQSEAFAWANGYEAANRRIAELEAELERAHLDRIEAQNPGIDMEAVKQSRLAALSTEEKT